MSPMTSVVSWRSTFFCIDEEVRTSAFRAPFRCIFVLKLDRENKAKLSQSLTSKPRRREVDLMWRFNVKRPKRCRWCLTGVRWKRCRAHTLTHRRLPWGECWCWRWWRGLTEQLHLYTEVGLTHVLNFVYKLTVQVFMCQCYTTVL